MSEIRPRASWDARPPKMENPLPRFTNGVVVHWLGVAAGGPGDEIARLRAAQRYHMDTKGWLDIAYHFAIGNSGAIYECRGFDIQGGATSGMTPNGQRWNHSSYAVVFLLQKGESVSDEAIAAFNTLMQKISDHHDGKAFQSISHQRASGSTECPGVELHALFNGVGWPKIPVPKPPAGEPWEILVAGLRKLADDIEAAL